MDLLSQLRIQVGLSRSEGHSLESAGLRLTMALAKEGPDNWGAMAGGARSLGPSRKSGPLAWDLGLKILESLREEGPRGYLGAFGTLPSELEGSGACHFGREADGG